MRIKENDSFPRSRLIREEPHGTAYLLDRHGHISLTCASMHENDRIQIIVSVLSIGHANI